MSIVHPRQNTTLVQNMCTGDPADAERFGLAYVRLAWCVYENCIQLNRPVTRVLVFLDERLVEGCNRALA